MSSHPPLETSRDRIRGAALRLFALHGFDGVSLQKIADEVGLHKSSLFHHYRNKLELATDVFEAAMVRVVETMRPLAAEPVPDVEKFLECIDELTDYFADNPDTARLVVAFMIAPGESEMRLPVTPDSVHPVTAFFRLFWSWLERAQAAGKIRQVNVRQAIFNLIGAVVLYPAVAEETSDIAGPDPFSEKHRRIRKRELRVLVRGMLCEE